MSGRRSSLTRRHFVGGALAAMLAGCTGTDDSETTRTTGGPGETAQAPRATTTAGRTTEATDATAAPDETTDSTPETTPDEGGQTTTTEARSLALEEWIPRPALTSGKRYYLISDVVFWNLGRIRRFEDALHPEFYNRITQLPDADALGVSPSSVDARIDVASQSARIYLGSFEREAVAEALAESGLAKDRELGEFDLFVPGETGYQSHVAVGENAVVVGEGAGIRMANDSRSSDIGPRNAAVETVDAHRTGEGRYADASEPVRRLTEVASAYDSGTVRTFERVSTPEPENLRFTGCVGNADGFEFSRPKSTFVVTFLYSDPEEAVVDPIREQFEQKPGLNEFDDVSYETDGRTVTVRARMENERFDGYLPGDPADRA